MSEGRKELHSSEGGCHLSEELQRSTKQKNIHSEVCQHVSISNARIVPSQEQFSYLAIDHDI